MKIKFDIDATPQELRTFFGLPEVETFQKEMMQEMRKKMLEGAEGFDPVSLMKPLLPEHLQSMSAMQKSFWDAFTKPSRKEEKDD